MFKKSIVVGNEVMAADLIYMKFDHETWKPEEVVLVPSEICMGGGFRDVSYMGIEAYDNDCPYQCWNHEYPYEGDQGPGPVVVCLSMYVDGKEASSKV